MESGEQECERNRNACGRATCAYLAVLLFIVVCCVGCTRRLDTSGVLERTGIKLPPSATDLHASVDGGYDPATYVRVEIAASDVKCFLSDLPKASKVTRSDNPYGGFDGAPPWWDITNARRCILFSAPDAGYGRVEGLIALDDPKTPVLYLYSFRGL